MRSTILTGYRAANYGDDSPSYPGPVPTSDVLDLFNTLKVGEYPVTAGPVTDPTRKAIIREPRSFGPNDPGAILGTFKSGYAIHPYPEWCVEKLEFLLDDGLTIASAGMVKGGAVAWVQAELPQECVAADVAYRPYVVAATSLDGSTATTYTTGAHVLVCDNMLSSNVRRVKDAVRIKHTRNSRGRIGEIRSALGLVQQTVSDFNEHVESLANVTVTDAEIDKFFEAYAPTQGRTGRGLTRSQNTQETLRKLWIEDPRVSPWKGTQWGVVQMMNTYAHHEQGTRGQDPTERNFLRLAQGNVDDLDAETLRLLATVTH